MGGKSYTFGMKRFLPFLLLPFAALPAFSSDGLDLSGLDRKTDPCQDFYQFACGGWLKNNPIPADQSSWGRFHEVAEKNRLLLKDILEKASAAEKPSAEEQKLGDFYSSCMDEEKVESLGVGPVRPELARIDALNSTLSLPAELGRFHSEGVPALFNFGSEQDYKDATQFIPVISQGGLGLPERDYYLREDAESVKLRGQYVEHVGKMFSLAGYDAQSSSAAARAVLAIETELARVSLDNVALRDPANTYHKMTPEKLAALTPGFDWNAYFSAAGLKKSAALNVSMPDFFRGMDRLLASIPLDAWKTYLRWNVLNSRADLLPRAFVNQNFDFYGKTLSGAKELRPRWKRCVDQADGMLGEALGKSYVERAFAGQSRERAIEMVRNIEKAMGEDIGAQDWMSPPTRKQALVKLALIENKIGYPQKWRDYSAYSVAREDAFGNFVRGWNFELRRRLDRIGKPVDRSEWDMSAPTVNAYYDPGMNTINFPAGILQFPFFDAKADDAINYGGIGGIIGHELTHGFDDQGRKFDEKGNMRDWWTENDALEFDRRSSCFVNQYSSFTAVGDVSVNGKLTLGENTADNGGLRLALMALEMASAGKESEGADGFTPRQRLFLGWGQVWCTNYRDESLRMQVLTDEHSPAKYRVNGVVINMPEFSSAFSCRKGSPMAGEKPCRVW